MLICGIPVLLSHPACFSFSKPLNLLPLQLNTFLKLEPQRTSAQLLILK